MLGEGGAFVLCSLLLLIKNVRIGQDKTALTVLSPGLELLHVTPLQPRVICSLLLTLHVIYIRISCTLSVWTMIFFRSHVAPGKEPFPGLVSVRLESGGGSKPLSTLCLFLTMWVWMILFHVTYFSEVEWWTLRRPFIHPTSVSLIFQAPCCLEYPESMF